MLAFLVKACVAALKNIPEFNASLEQGGENLVLKKYYQHWFCGRYPDGLVVPVIRNADRKSVLEIGKEMTELSAKAVERKLSNPATCQGGTAFRYPSLGGIGGMFFTPIINAPEVAILGVSRRDEADLDRQAGEFEPRLMLPLSLSYDHRVIDGAAGARFSTYLAGLMTDIRKLVL